jgi:hypothetical protein
MTITKKIADSRRTITLTSETGDKLKAFARKHNLKMYEAVDSMVDVINDNEEVGNMVAKLTKERSHFKKADNEIFSKKVGKLPTDLQDKLKSMSTEQLSAFLSKAGL